METTTLFDAPQQRERDRSYLFEAPPETERSLSWPHSRQLLDIPCPRCHSRVFEEYEPEIGGPVYWCQAASHTLVFVPKGRTIGV